MLQARDAKLCYEESKLDNNEEKKLVSLKRRKENEINAQLALYLKIYLSWLLEGILDAQNNLSNQHYVEACFNRPLPFIIP